MCWSESPSGRPTARRLLHCLQDTSHTWVPPLKYPILDDLDEEPGLDVTSGDERSIVTDALASNLFVLVVSMLCVLLFPLI